MSRTRKITYSALFICLGLILPLLTGQIRELGTMLTPMHFPVLIGSIVCGGMSGFMIGIITPLLRSMLFQMPILFPSAFAMAFELGTYGWSFAYLYKKLKAYPFAIYIALILAMLGGRLLWGLVMTIIMNLQGNPYTMSMFMSGAVLNSIPGILLQLLLIPLIVKTLQKYDKL